AGDAQVVGEREQTLLRAVVQVALEPPALRISAFDHARPRRLQVAEPGEQLGLESLVLDRQPRGGAERALELRALEERCVVRDEGDRASAARDRGYCPPVIRTRLLVVALARI